MRIVEWVRRVWYLLNRSAMERALQEEMEAHREMMGEPVRFGNTLRLREVSRDAWGWNWLDAVYRDCRFGIRGLRREPTFATAAILTLALGVATTTTVFSVADAELWRALPYPQPEQLVAVYSRGPATNAMSDSLSGPDLVEWRANATAFSGLAAVGRTSRQIMQLDAAQSVLVTEVTANYFTVLGRAAIAGIVPSSGLTPGPRLAILTDRGWKRLFNGDASIVGRSVVLNGETANISAVVWTDDSLGRDPDLFIVIDESAQTFNDRGTFGRLRAGSSAIVAREQLEAAEARLAQAGTTSRAGHVVYVEDLRSYYTGSNWRPLYFFLGASAFVLLLSVINVATLLLERAFRRTREFAIRAALGGGQRALVRPLIVEGGLLTLFAAAIALMLCLWAVEFFTTQLPGDFLLRGGNIPMDYRVYGFVVVLAVLITMVFGMAPLVLLRRVDLSTALSAGGRAGASAHDGRMRRTLLIAQMALTVVLMAGAGMFLKSFAALTQTPLGFDARNAFVVRASLSGPRYSTDLALRTYANALLDVGRRNPNVEAAAIASSSPLGSGPLVMFVKPGQSASTEGGTGRGILRAVSPGYFRTLGIKIVQGREFSQTDSFGAPRVAIVNQALARQAFGDASAVGQTLELAPGARVPWTRRAGSVLIVGVAAHVKDVDINEIEFPNMYFPFDQTPAPSVELIARTDGSVQGVSQSLAQDASRLDPVVPVSPPVSLEQRVSAALQGDRFNAWLVSGFAAVALVLAAVGIYGTVAYNVQARTRELGVRLALGAQPTRLFAGALFQAGRLGIVAGLFGLAGAVALAIAIGDALYLTPGSHKGMLYGVTTTDPLMLGMAFCGILAVALVAALIPARRVVRVDPVSALKTD